jgi:hypothetical protein
VLFEGECVIDQPFIPSVVIAGEVCKLWVRYILDNKNFCFIYVVNVDLTIIYKLWSWLFPYYIIYREQKMHQIVDLMILTHV